jgi:Ran GTPase-activating protein (RanGAP) involved in mRNA processing and transport
MNVDVGIILIIVKHSQPYFHLIQTLTTLSLRGNNIGVEGAQHLAHAIKNNMVRQASFSSIVYRRLLLNVDAYHAES